MGGIGILGAEDERRLDAVDERLLEEWFRVLKDTHGEFLKFMGDGPNGRPGHNRRMLTYFAGLPEDRQRLIVMHGWQIDDHMCNTGRANASEWNWRYGLSVALALPALVFAFEEKWILVGAYLGGAAFFLFLPIWRKYLPGRND